MTINHFTGGRVHEYKFVHPAVFVAALNVNLPRQVQILIQTGDNVDEAGGNNTNVAGRAGHCALFCIA